MEIAWKRLAGVGSIGLALSLGTQPIALAQHPTGDITASAQAPSPAASTQSPKAGPSGPQGHNHGPLRPGHSAGVSPSGQGPASATPRFNKASIAHLRNPFDWEGFGPNRGLLGATSVQPSPQYPAPPGAGGLPAPGGMPGAPGALAPPGTAPWEAGPTMPAPNLPGAELSAPTAAAPGAEGPTLSPEATAAGADALAAAAAEGPGFGGGLGASSEAFPMIGDQGPLFQRQTFRFPPIPGPLPPGVPRPNLSPGVLAGRAIAAIVPAVRGFKTADNQYPRPVDRVWVNFNYYDDVNAGINSILQAPIKGMQVYREVFGVEKTILDQQASVGFRLPLQTLTIMSDFPGLGGTHTSTGNFSSYFKYAVYDDGPNFLSVGLDLTFPTGPKNFAGYPALLGINAMEIQPFVGYIFQRGRAYLQGFNSIMVPLDRRLATMYYCDIGLGYFVYKSSDPRAILSFLVPTFETHLNIPLNWAGLQPQYIGSTPTVVDLTWALNVGLANRAVLSAAYVRPVTGPLPFGGEFALMLNVPFGGRPGRPFPLTPPPSVR